MNPIYKRTLKFAIPIMIQNGITNAVSLVDNLMVGSLGTDSMTGVSIAGQLIFVFSLAVFGGMSGPGIYGAQYYGQGNEEGFHNVFRLKLWIAAILACGGILLFGLFGPQLVGLYLHGTDQNIDPVNTLRLALQYLNIMLIGFVPYSLTQVYAGALREMGESLKPMVAGVVSVVVDIIFNYLLIYGKFGCPRLGVQGAAIATVLARFMECAVVVVWTHAAKKDNPFLTGLYRTVKIPLRRMKTIIVKSIPLFLNEFFWAGGMAALTQCYSMRGLTIVAGLNISNAICNLLNVVFVAMGNAVGIITGQFLGASRFEEAKKNATRLMWFTAAICLGLTVILISLSGIFPEFYQTTPQVKQLGRQFIIITALFFPVQGFLNALYFTLRSGGKTTITFLFDSVFTWLVAVVAAFLMCRYTTIPIMYVYTIIQAADFIKLLVGYVLIRRGVWITNLVAD